MINPVYHKSVSEQSLFDKRFIYNAPPRIESAGPEAANVDLYREIDGLPSNVTELPLRPRPSHPVLADTIDIGRSAVDGILTAGVKSVGDIAATALDLVVDTVDGPYQAISKIPAKTIRFADDTMNYALNVLRPEKKGFFGTIASVAKKALLLPWRAVAPVGAAVTHSASKLSNMVGGMASFVSNSGAKVAALGVRVA